jgi:hypothetical protein
MNPVEAEALVARANEASRVLSEPLLVDALDALRADLYAKLVETNWRQRAARESIYHQLKAMDNMEAQLRFHIENGRVARSWLENYRAERELRKERRRRS